LAKRNFKKFIKILFGGKKTVPTVVCPECSEDVYVDAESEQGDIVSCDECGVDLEVVGLDPFELDLYEEKDTFEDEVDYESLDYENERY
jgi:alpha-aminoadipate carrier protein LysW